MAYPLDDQSTGAHFRAACFKEIHMKDTRRKNSVVATMLLLLALLVPAATQAAPQLSIPVTGTPAGGGTFSGVFTITGFAVRDGQVVARGTMSGVLTTATGLAESVLTTVALPIAIGATTCEILHLDIGPIAIDLLGLQVDLSRIVLDITAQAGAGNLLGNLLCAVAGLLDNPGGLARLLNQILAAL
jgi:hypothetical protein